MSLVFVVLLLLPCSTYIGRHHIMIFVILGAALLAVASLVSITLAAFKLEASNLTADRVITRLQTDNFLPASITATNPSLLQVLLHLTPISSPPLHHGQAF